MKLTLEPITLNLRTTFRIAHGADDQRFNVLARLEHDGLLGLGEAAAVAYHGETQAGILAYLAQVQSADPELLGENPALLEDVLGRLPPGSAAARAALDLAMYDLWGQALGRPLYHLLGLNPARAPLTSFTIALDEPEVMAERALQSGYPIIKIKLGSPDDLAIVRAIHRAAPLARLRVDANAGWGREQAAALLPRLAEAAGGMLEFVEQPLAKGDTEGLRWLREQRFGLPIFADESIKTAADVAVHAGAVDGVVIKLMKSAGIRAALRAIATARALEMQVMIGCMIETAVGVSAAAHLAPLCDYADLDGPLLIRNAVGPTGELIIRGVQYDGARLLLPDRPGLGLRLG